MTAEIITGYNVTEAVTLKKDGSTFSIAADSTVKVGIVNRNHNGVYVEPITQDRNAVGADYDNSLIVVEIPSTATSSITDQGSAFFEIAITDADGTTGRPWFLAATIITGHPAE